MPTSLNSLYIYSQQPHSLLCTSITPPEDELQQQLRKFVNKSPYPEEVTYPKNSILLPSALMRSHFTCLADKIKCNVLLMHNLINLGLVMGVYALALDVQLASQLFNLPEETTIMS